MVSVLTGVLIIGGAAALLVSMYVLGPADNPWIKPENEALLVIDLVSGVLLVVLGATQAFSKTGGPTAIFATAFLALLAHSYRSIAYLLEQSSAFCANGALFLLNNLKLMSLGILLVSLLVSEKEDTQAVCPTV